jgi:hypothetical protein
MATFQRITVVSDTVVYTLEQYSSSTELVSHDRVTGEMLGMYNVLDFAQPIIGETWHLRLSGGVDMDTPVVVGARVDLLNPRSASYIDSTELDRYSSFGMFA